MLKRISALLLALLVMLPCAAFAAREDELIVGNTTQLRGDFFTEMWGNSASDADVRALLHGYNLVMWDGERGEYTVDPSVVSGLAVTENSIGDRTYTLVLYDDLYYSDGMPITAWDYAFSELLCLSPEIAKLGGTPLRRDHLMGSEDYSQGLATVLTGVRVLDDHRLSITVRNEYLPYFYEYSLLDCLPYPMHVIAPGCTVRDDGEGAYIANVDDVDGEPLFTTRLLRQTILGAAGYRSYPSVVSGPYTLVSFDGSTATLDINPLYKGDAQGSKPSIPRVVYTLADSSAMMRSLWDGELDLVTRVTGSSPVSTGMQLAAASDTVSMASYPRTGLSYISFSCEKPALSSASVRQAIAWCLDREALARQYVGGHGLKVDGWYGLGQWVYQLLSGPEDVLLDITGGEKLTLDGLTPYTLDTDKAPALLEKDGWTLNRQGQMYDPDQDDVRCKQISGQLVPLDLVLAYPQGSLITQSLREHFLPNLAAAGIKVSIMPMSMKDLLSSLYQQSVRPVDMILLGSNFPMAFDPASNFALNERNQTAWNYTNLDDPTLFSLALSLRHTEPGDVVSYCQRWIAFQERFSQSLPMLPLYSNVYYDFYTSALRDYSIASSGSWAEAILKAKLEKE